MNTRIFTSLFVCIFTAAVVGHQQAPQSTQGVQDQKSKNSNESRPPRPPFRWWTMEKYRQELKLTADQATQIEKIYQVSMDRLKAQKDDFDRAQSDFQQLSDLRLIIYDQYLCLIHSSKTFMNEVLTGMDITKREPDEFDFSSSTLPPNASVNPLTMERPRPDPFDFTLADRENLSHTR